MPKGPLSEEQLARLKQLEIDGCIDAETIVDDATPVDSPLHELFEWDDAVAGHKYRLGQARALLRVRYLHHADETLLVPVPSYVRDPFKPANKPGYVTMLVLKTDEDRARQAVQQDCARAESALRRAHAVAAALGIEDEILDLLTRLMALKTKLEADSAVPPPLPSDHSVDLLGPSDGISLS